MTEGQISKVYSLFMHDAVASSKKAEIEDLNFVQYTSAEAAMNIIRSNEIWLRNTQCMNDYLEIAHGQACLVTAFKDEPHGNELKSILEDIFPGIIKEFTDLFDMWLPSYRTQTYISCLSEHPKDENQYGRLSMWRAYGGSSPVALVIKKDPIMEVSDVLEAYSYPVNYKDIDSFNEQFSHLVLRMESEKEFLKKLGKDTVFSYLFEAFSYLVLCTKHPGFKEEREWRVVYSPSKTKNKYIKSSIESIDGVPQDIYKIPLRDFPEENYGGTKISNILDRVIIGPCDHQAVLKQTFIKLLNDAGCENSFEKVFISGIPLR